MTPCNKQIVLKQQVESTPITGFELISLKEKKKNMLEDFNSWLHDGFKENGGQTKYEPESCNVS